MKNKLLIRRLLAATISLSMLGNALQLHAEVCCAQGTVVAFFNGVLTPIWEAKHTQKLLMKIHGQTTADGWPIQYELM